MKTAALTLTLLMGLCGSAAAHEPLPPLGAYLFGGVVRESDVDLLFDWLRESARAAVEGREAPPPDALVSRAEQIGDEVKRRGGIAARIFIDVIERSVREAMRERPAPPQLPPTAPAQRL
jgi:hypothetical protein